MIGFDLPQDMEDGVRLLEEPVEDNEVLGQERKRLKKGMRGKWKTHCHSLIVTVLELTEVLSVEWKIEIIITLRHTN
uniref:Uncharacterized protein n=1 Tax=Amphimedon queenslandica TaxID=400682 RepID=A0A1X7SE05_AMPQE